MLHLSLSFKKARMARRSRAMRAGEDITRGFTLIETIVTVTMFAVVFSAMMFVIEYFYRTNAYVFEQTKAVESAHIGIINAMRDLREASYGED